jgi:Protein of unknown function (DUF2735)
MNTSFSHGSATIYQFPAGGRDALRSHRDSAAPSADLASLRVSEVGFGDAWYHAEAIREAERASKP